MVLMTVNFPLFFPPSSSLIVTDIDVQPEARTLRTAQPLIWVFAASLRSDGDPTCLS